MSTAAITTLNRCRYRKLCGLPPCARIRSRVAAHTGTAPKVRRGPRAGHDRRSVRAEQPVPDPLEHRAGRGGAGARLLHHPDHDEAGPHVAVPVMTDRAPGRQPGRVLVAEHLGSTGLSADLVT